jgi:phospholipid/cholesterol/gamma-HCH transport system substrate-binding protein
MSGLKTSLRRLSPPQLRSLNPVPIGAVFLVVMAMLMYLAFNIGKLPFTSGASYSAAFPEVAGLHVGDRVRIAGIDEGKVSAIALEGTHVKVSFTVNKGVRLGSDTTASIKIFTLLGNKYLEIDPGTGGTWPQDRELPLSQTSAPYDVTQAFQDVSHTVERIHVAELARAFDTIASTFKNSPPAVRAMLSGLSRLSQTVASRDQQLGTLVRHASNVTGVLADRREQLAHLLGDGSQLLRMVRERQAVIKALLTNTTELSDQLGGLIDDNHHTLAPMLRHLHDVTAILAHGQSNLDESIQRLFQWTRRNIDTIGDGPWFDGEVINATNPIQLPKPARLPKGKRLDTFGQLFGVPNGSGR